MVSEYGWRARFAAQGGPGNRGGGGASPNLFGYNAAGIGPGGVAGTPYTQALARAA